MTNPNPDIPFGKFKGTHLYDLPYDYLQWLKKVVWNVSDINGRWGTYARIEIDRRDEIVKSRNKYWETGSE